MEGRNWKTGVWTEPQTMKAAYWEFEEDTAKQVATAEDLTSAYRFGVYDFLILPNSFPYGGMENCCLTFATPTLLAGDRSLVDVIAHEISHVSSATTTPANSSLGLVTRSAALPGRTSG